MRRFAVLALVLALSVALLATGASPSGAQRETQRATRKVTLVTHDSFNVSEEVLDAFTDETGIEVEILRAGDTGTMVNQVILTKDNPLGDVMYGIDNTFLTRALDEGVFERYRSPRLDRVPAELRRGTRSRVTPIDFGDVCINYDKDWFAERDLPVPRTLDDLTKPRYRGRLVVEDPSSSSPGLAFLLATIAEYGSDGWTEYWKRLRANDVTVVDSWEQAYYDEFSGGGQGGDHPLVVSYASSPAAAVVFAETPIEESPIGTMTESCFRQVEYAGILAGTPRRQAARALVDFLLSDEFQADVPLQMYVYPAVTGIELPEVFTANADVVEDPYTMTPARIGRHRDRWLREWTGVVLR